MRALAALALSAFGLAGCTSAGFGKSIAEGPDGETYVLRDVGRLTVGSGDTMKERLLQDAEALCTGKGKTVEVVSASARDAIPMDRVPSAMVKVRCVSK
ncbi:hypothetical protein GCM10027034_17890 [Ramlibacter solisilvae]|uniref:Lipoprotein n=1 Tax=Ramlibacter tataouinensis TaxID=94132 RepID=A0A127JVN4_9BURK|nr:hypothetical protein UC35_15950 [Ramlibacter tataouinensis]